MRIGIVLLLAAVAFGQEKDAPDPAKRKVYFGEQHLHTMNSPDAFAFGTRNSPDDAYNYAKGKAIQHLVTGEMVQRKTPYDWCAVTDHAEYLGVMPMLLDKNSALRDTEIGKLIAAGKGEAAFQLLIDSASKNVAIPYLADPNVMRTAWQRQKDAANRHYEPGKFTTLIAFEWSSQPASANMHHNVFFRDEGPDAVYSSFDSVRREDLWTYQEVQRGLGHENFSIPHNSNVSDSRMFAPVNSYGAPIDRKWAERYMRNSVAVEIIQTKGCSETHPVLSPYDEFAGFEMKFIHLLGSGHCGTGGVVGKVDHSFVRRALIDGLGFRRSIGANPFKFGIVAGADSHNAFSGSEEDNYRGVHGNTDKTPQVRLGSTGSVAGEAPLAFGTPGATGVWADENTRAGIFDGIKRKETFGTSGPLIRLRVFGGWNFSADMMKNGDWVKRGYSDGVPMGGDLPKRAGKAPTFAVFASKDPNSGNLDRIQIVKGYTTEGHSLEEVYDVVWSGDRKPDPKTGKLPPVGNTVDVKQASYTNTIGAAQLAGVWTDPHFHPDQHAVYYVRVLEIPTPRWSTYDAKTLGVEPPAGHPAVIQERAWSSPIWYIPSGK